MIARLQTLAAAFPTILGGYALAAVIVGAIAMAGRW